MTTDVATATAVAKHLLWHLAVMSIPSRSTKWSDSDSAARPGRRRDFDRAAGFAGGRYDGAAEPAAPALETLQ